MRAFGAGWCKGLWKRLPHPEGGQAMVEFVLVFPVLLLLVLGVFQYVELAAADLVLGAATQAAAVEVMGDAHPNTPPMTQEARLIGGYISLLTGVVRLARFQDPNVEELVKLAVQSMMTPYGYENAHQNDAQLLPTGFGLYPTVRVLEDGSDGLLVKGGILLKLRVPVVGAMFASPESEVTAQENEHTALHGKLKKLLSDMGQGNGGQPGGAAGGGMDLVRVAATTAAGFAAATMNVQAGMVVVPGGVLAPLVAWAVWTALDPGSAMADVDLAIASDMPRTEGPCRVLRRTWRVPRLYEDAPAAEAVHFLPSWLAKPEAEGSTSTRTVRGFSNLEDW